jgi:hypothetical protein
MGNVRSRSGRGKQIEAKGSGKGSWESVKRDDEPGSICWTSIPRQALVPGEPPMRALRSGEDLLCGARAAWWREWSGTFQTDRLAADHFQPGWPDAAPWPVAPEHRSGRRVGRGWVRRRRGIHVRRGEWPQDCTDSPWLERGVALLALCPQRAGTTMTNACGIQES